VQLLPYICDKTKGDVVRRVAIFIAEACELHSLQEDPANIALDLTQSMHIREIASHAICNIGDNKTKTRLLPLATGDAGSDPDDQLKGYGLRCQRRFKSAQYRQDNSAQPYKYLCSSINADA
jgi:hypothetical protein